MGPPLSARKALYGGSQKAEKAGGKTAAGKNPVPPEEELTIHNYTELPKGHPDRLEMALKKVIEEGSLPDAILAQGGTLVYVSDDEKYYIREHPDGRKYRRLAKPGTEFELFHDPEKLCPACKKKHQ